MSDGLDRYRRTGTRLSWSAKLLAAAFFVLIVALALLSSYG